MASASAVLRWLKSFRLWEGEQPSCNWCRRTPSPTQPHLKFATAGILFPSGGNVALCTPCQVEYLNAPDHHEIIFVSLATPQEAQSLLRAIPRVDTGLVEQFMQGTGTRFTTFEILEFSERLVRFWNDPPVIWQPQGDRCCTWKARLKIFCAHSGTKPPRFAGLTLTLSRFPASGWGTRSQEWLTVLKTGQNIFQVEKRVQVGHFDKDPKGQLDQF